MNNQERFALVFFGLFVVIFHELIHIKDTHDKFDATGIVIVAIGLIIVAIIIPRKR